MTDTDTSDQDRRLQEGVTAPVLIGDRVVFGDVRCELMDAVLLYKRLRSTPL